MRRRPLLVGVEVAVPLVLVALLWAWTSDSGVYYYPPLPDVLRAFADSWLFAQVGSDLVPSVTRLLAGFAIAAVVGVVGGLMLGRSRHLRRVTHPIIEFLRSLPAPALIPFAILVLGIGDGSKILLIAFVCLWPILLTTTDGVAGVDPTQLDTARAYRIPARDRLLHVVLPAASPQIFAGLRTSLSLALVLMVVSEMVASTDGIGYTVLQAQRSFNITEMWAGIILLGLLGILLNALLTVVERRTLDWHRRLHRGAH